MSTVAVVAFGQRTTVSTVVRTIGSAFRLGANPWGVNFIAPDSLCTIEASNDKLHWVTAHDVFGDQPINEIKNLGDVYKVSPNRPKWLRFNVEADASEPRDFTAAGIVQKKAG